MAREEDARRLVELQRDARFRATVTAVTVLRDGVAYTLARPTAGSPRISAAAGQHGESVRLFAGDLALSMMVAARHRTVRVAVEQVRQVWRPEEG